MQITVTYDASVANAPAGFQTAVQAAVQYFESQISSPITVNINVGYGEVGGQALSAGQLSASLTTYVGLTYEQTTAALGNRINSPAMVEALLSLPTPPADSSISELPFVEARVLGLATAQPGVPDGYIGLSADAPFTFDPNNRAVPGEYDAIGAIEHEISEVLGRETFDGTQPPGPTGGPRYAMLDFFRYSAPGVHTYTPGPGSFSLNGDQLLLPFNDPANGGDGAVRPTATRLRSGAMSPNPASLRP